MSRLAALAALAALSLAACDSTPATPDDTTPPDVQITAPAANAVVAGAVAVRYTADDASALATAELLVDGEVRAVAPAAGVGELTFDSPDLADGTHTLAVRVTDAAGNEGTSPVLSVQTANDASAVALDQIVLRSAAFVRPDGTAWDPASAPDFALVVRTAGGALVARLPTIVDAAPSDLPATFDGAFAMSLDEDYVVALVEEDLADDEEVGSSQPYDPGGDVRAQPETVVLDLGGGTRVQLNLTWTLPVAREGGGR